MKVLDDILKHVNAWSEAHKLRKPTNPVSEEPVREKAFKPDANEKHDPKSGQFTSGSTKVPGTNRRVAVGRVERESQNRASRSGPPKFKKGPLPMTRGGYVDAVGQKPQPPMKAVGATKSILEPKKQVPDAMKRADKHLGFKKLENKLAHKPGITNPAAVAAAIGRKKFGAKGMAAKAAAGRK